MWNIVARVQNVNIATKNRIEKKSVPVAYGWQWLLETWYPALRPVGRDAYTRFLGAKQNYPSSQLSMNTSYCFVASLAPRYYLLLFIVQNSLNRAKKSKTDTARGRYR